MVAISSWGRLSRHEHSVHFFSDRTQHFSFLNEEKLTLPFGMGRSYGDQCLNPKHALLNSTRLDKFISFDKVNGILACESGVLLGDIQQLVIPQGWILPVTPGTQFVTLGGAIANDVHGKNHHLLGSFGNHLKNITLVRSDGRRISCSPTHEEKWFSATLGGCGLTGFILSAEIQLLRVASAWLETETIAFENFTEFLKLSAASEKEWCYTVSWIDCLSASSRGLLMRANPLQCNRPEPSPRKIRFPFAPPVSLINSLSLKLFNQFYYTKNKFSTKNKLAHYTSFFYPLDNLLEWNRIYGPNGFYQYQCVIPSMNAQDAIPALLHEIKRSGEGSFLAVLKTLGDIKPLGMLSFPMQGITLALDFRNLNTQRNGNKTDQLFERLDAIVQSAGGRIYLAKDARMPKALFESSYPNLNEFLPFRDPAISSAMSRRLMGY